MGKTSGLIQFLIVAIVLISITLFLFKALIKWAIIALIIYGIVKYIVPIFSKN